MRYDRGDLCSMVKARVSHFCRGKENERVMGQSFRESSLEESGESEAIRPGPLRRESLADGEVPERVSGKRCSDLSGEFRGSFHKGEDRTAYSRDRTARRFLDEKFDGEV